MAKAQHTLGPRQMIELIVGPARQHVAMLGITHHDAVRREFHRNGTPRAGLAIEKDSLPGNRHRQIPPTLRASASPSPSAELGTPAAFTWSSASRPENSSVSTLCFHSRSRTVAW